MVPIKAINPSVLVEGEIGDIGTGSEIHDTARYEFRNLTTPEEARLTKLGGNADKSQHQAAEVRCAERRNGTSKRVTTMNKAWSGLAKFSSIFLRLALGTSFLSAVADRFGLWGAYGQPNIAWGNYARFVDYTAKLNWFLPPSTIPTLANVATIAETLLGLLLVLGWQTRISALLSGVLLAIFALAMTVALGVKAPLNLSVFSAAGGALLLATCTDFRYSLDEWLGRKR